MKKSLFILTLVMSAVTMMAENSVSRDNSDEVVIIERIGNTYYYKDLTMNQRECDEFLANKSIPAYRAFHNGYKLQKKGWALFGAGLGLEAVGTALTIASFFVKSDAAIATMLGLGTTSLVVGSCCELACIPVLIVGYGRMHDSIDNYYVEQKAKQRALNLSLNASQNGIGLALKF